MAVISGLYSPVMTRRNSRSRGAAAQVGAGAEPAARHRSAPPRGPRRRAPRALNAASSSRRMAPFSAFKELGAIEGDGQDGLAGLGQDRLVGGRRPSRPILRFGRGPRGRCAAMLARPSRAGRASASASSSPMCMAGIIRAASSEARPPRPPPGSGRSSQARSAARRGPRRQLRGGDRESGRWDPGWRWRPARPCAASSAPSSPVPTAPPIVRLNWTSPVACPRCRQLTAPWIATSSGVVVNPMPRPVTAVATAVYASDWTVPAWVSSPVPATRSAVPISTMGRTPQRRMARPLHDRADGPADAHGAHRQAGLERRTAHHALDQRRHVGGQPEHHDARERSHRQAGGDDGAAQERHRDERLRRGALGAHEAGPAGRRRPPGSRAMTGESQPRVLALGGRQQEECHAEGQGQRRRRGRADAVDARPARAGSAPMRTRGSEAHRHVDVEDPAPADGGGDECRPAPAPRWRPRPRRSRRRPASAPAAAAVEDVAHDGEGDGLHGARAEALDGAEDDEHQHRLRQAAERGAAHEQRQPTRKMGLRPRTSARVEKTGTVVVAVSR